MLPQETRYHLLVRIHFETRTGGEQKAPHAPMNLWLTCRRLAWSVKCIAVCYSRWVWRSKRGQQKKNEGTRPRACLVHTIKKSSSTTKRPCSSPPKFLVAYGADNNKSSVYTLETWLCCWRPKDSLLACLRTKISCRWWTFYLARKRVCQNDRN